MSNKLEIVVTMVRDKLVITNSQKKIIVNNNRIEEALKKNSEFKANGWSNIRQLSVNPILKEKIISLFETDKNEKKHDKKIKYWISPNLKLEGKLSRSMLLNSSIATRMDEADIVFLNHVDIDDCQQNERNRVFVLITGKNILISRNIHIINKVDFKDKQIMHEDTYTTMWSVVTRAKFEYLYPQLNQYEYLRLVYDEPNINYKTEIGAVYPINMWDTQYLTYELLKSKKVSVDMERVFSEISFLQKKLVSLVKHFGFSYYDQFPYKLVLGQFIKFHINYFFVSEDFYEAFNCGFLEILSAYLNTMNDKNTWIYFANKSNYYEATLKYICCELLNDKKTKKNNFSTDDIKLLLTDKFILKSIESDTIIKEFIDGVKISVEYFCNQCLKVECFRDENSIYEFYGVNLSTEIERCLRALIMLSINCDKIDFSQIKLLTQSTFTDKEEAIINQITKKSGYHFILHEWKYNNILPHEINMYKISEIGDK